MIHYKKNFNFTRILNIVHDNFAAVALINSKDCLKYIDPKLDLDFTNVIYTIPFKCCLRNGDKYLRKIVFIIYSIIISIIMIFFNIIYHFYILEKVNLAKEELN